MFKDEDYQDRIDKMSAEDRVVEETGLKAYQRLLQSFPSNLDLRVAIAYREYANHNSTIVSFPNWLKFYHQELYKEVLACADNRVTLAMKDPLFETGTGNE